MTTPAERLKNARLDAGLSLDTVIFRAKVALGETYGPCRVGSGRLHVWAGAHPRDPQTGWWADTCQVRLRGSWRTYRRRVLWVGRRFIGIQSAASPLPRVSDF